MNTRSHSELGRENFQHQWYCVSRHGRVGRCQVFQARRSSSEQRDKKRVAGFYAGWSSPVARQAHNLKVVGSNSAPATNFRASNPRLRPVFVGFFGLVLCCVTFAETSRTRLLLDPDARDAVACFVIVVCILAGYACFCVRLL